MAWVSWNILGPNAMLNVKKALRTRQEGQVLVLGTQGAMEMRPGWSPIQAAVSSSPMQPAISLGDAASALRGRDTCSSSSLGGALDHRAPGPGLLTSWHQDLLNISGWKVPSLLSPPSITGTCGQDPVTGEMGSQDLVDEKSLGQPYRWHLEIQNSHRGYETD